MELEDLVVPTTTFEPVDVLIKPLPSRKPLRSTKPLPPTKPSLLPYLQYKEDKEKRDKEERAEIEAAEEKWHKIMQSGMEVLRRTGQLIEIVYCKVDVRHLVNRTSNCDEIKWGNEPVDKEIVLERENALWNAAMEYRKVQNMASEYDLIPSNMTLFPIMSKKSMWYHCNLVGCKREFPSKGVQQHFFLEVNMTRGKTYNVTACITLADDDVDNTCKACPSHMGILHPCKGGFAFGCKEGPCKEDVGATPASGMDIGVPSPSISASLPTLGNESLGPVARRLSAFLGGETSQSVPPTVAGISAPPKSESLPTMLNGSPDPITKKQLELALARGGTSRPFPPVASARSAPLVSRLNQSPGPITKRQLELALALALAGGGTSSDSTSQDRPQCN